MFRILMDWIVGEASATRHETAGREVVRVQLEVALPHIFSRMLNPCQVVTLNYIYRRTGPSTRSPAGFFRVLKGFPELFRL